MLSAEPAAQVSRACGKDDDRGHAAGPVQDRRAEPDLRRHDSVLAALARAVEEQDHRENPRAVVTLGHVDRVLPLALLGLDRSQVEAGLVGFSGRGRGKRLNHHVLELDFHRPAGVDLHRQQPGPRDARLGLAVVHRRRLRPEPDVIWSPIARTV